MKKILLIFISCLFIYPVKAEDLYKYTIKYYYNNVIDENKTIINEAPYSNIIKSFELKPKDNYILEHSSIDNEGLTITKDESKNIINVYYTSENTKQVFEIIDETNKKNNLLKKFKNELQKILELLEKLFK